MTVFGFSSPLMFLNFSIAQCAFFRLDRLPADNDFSVFAALEKGRLDGSHGDFGVGYWCTWSRHFYRTSMSCRSLNRCTRTLRPLSSASGPPTRTKRYPAESGFTK
jgi:hypothetical protein